MMAKYSFGLFSASGTDTITVRAAGNTINYQLTPAMDIYPAISNGTSIIRGKRTGAGVTCEMEIELSGSGDQQNAIQGASYLQDIVDCWQMQPMKMLVDIMNAQDDQGNEHKLKRIRAVGFNETYNSSDMLEKLYKLADGTYQGLSSEGLSGEDELPVLDGTLNIHADVYEDSVETLRCFFPKLVLNITGEFYIRFVDSVTASICVSNWGDKVGLTKQKAASVMDIGTVFRNTEIKAFDELRLFTRLSLIQQGAFENCRKLESITLPSSMSFVAKYSFSACSNLRRIICLAKNPPSIETYTFEENINFYVPIGSLNAYKTATIWSQFASRIYPLSE